MGLYSTEEITELEVAVENTKSRNRKNSEKKNNTKAPQNPLKPNSIQKDNSTSIQSKVQPTLVVTDINNNVEKHAKLNAKSTNTTTLSHNNVAVDALQTVSNIADDKNSTVCDVIEASIVSEKESDENKLKTQKYIQDFCLCDPEYEKREFLSRLNLRCRNITQALGKLRKDLVS